MTIEKELFDRLMEVAKKKMPGFHVIIDLFDMTFVYVTKEGAEMSGYTQDDMIDKPISDFMSVKNSDEPFTKTIMKTLVGGLVRIPLITKSGEERLVEMKHVMVEIDGHPFLITKANKP